MKNHRLVSIFIPVTEMIFYMVSALIVDSKYLKRTFSGMSGLMAGQVITEIIRYIKEKPEEQ